MLVHAIPLCVKKKSQTENNLLDNLPVETTKRSLENPFLTNDSYDVERGLEGLISDVCLAEDDAGVADQVTWNGETLPSIPQSFLPIRMKLFIWILLADTKTYGYSLFCFCSSGLRVDFSFPSWRTLNMFTWTSLNMTARLWWAGWTPTKTPASREKVVPFPYLGPSPFWLFFFFLQI